MENGFSADPKLSHILNLHLRDNAVMKISFLDLQKKIKNLEATVAGVNKTADQAKSAADRLAKTKRQDVMRRSLPVKTVDICGTTL